MDESRAEELPGTEKGAGATGVTQLLIGVLNSLSASIAIIDAEGRVVTGNQGWFDFCLSIGPTGAALGIGSSYLDFCNESKCKCPQGKESVTSGIKDVLSGVAAEFSVEIECPFSDGPHWVRLLATPLSRGGFRGGVIMVTDINEEKRAEESLRDSERRFRILAENAQDLIYRYRVDPVPGYEYVSPSSENITGYSPEEYYADPRLGGPLLQAAEINVKGADGGGIAPICIECERKDGSRVWVEQTTAPITDGRGELIAIEGIVRNIDERMRAQEQIRHLATHDSLTGLPNRELFLDRLGQALAGAARDNRRVGIMMVDLDNFKEVNDTYGHDAGDQLLTQVARRLEHSVRVTDTVARLGGDEFAVIIPSLRNTSALTARASRMVRAVGEPYLISGKSLASSASIGITVYPDDHSASDDLMDHADMAMYRAKSHGGDNYQYFDAEMNRQARARAILESSLQEAWREKDFFLVYQPRINVATGDIAGLEALIRWRHRKQGVLLPEEFLAAAESSGLLPQITEWVLSEACRQARQWQEEGLPAVPVAVNFPVSHIKHEDYLVTIREALEASALDPGFLEIDLSEPSLSPDCDGVQLSLQDLLTTGVRLTIDDFGAGLTSLRHLNGLGATNLKLDNSIVGRITASREGRTTAGAAIQLGHSLGLTIIAEGVETEEQLFVLRSLGCDEAQGFLICPPLPVDSVPALVWKRRVVLTPQKTAKFLEQYSAG